MKLRPLKNNRKDRKERRVGVAGYVALLLGSRRPTIYLISWLLKMTT